MDVKEARDLLYEMTGGNYMWGTPGGDDSVTSDIDSKIDDLYLKDAKSRGLTEEQIDEVFEDATASSTFDFFATEEMTEDNKTWTTREEKVAKDVEKIRAESKSQSEFDRKINELAKQYVEEMDVHLDGVYIDGLYTAEESLFKDVPIKVIQAAEEEVWSLRDAKRKDEKARGIYLPPSYDTTKVKGLAIKGFNPKGWHNEPINHALAAKGIKVGKGRAKR